MSFKRRRNTTSKTLKTHRKENKNNMGNEPKNRWKTLVSSLFDIKLGLIQGILEAILETEPKILANFHHF